MPAVLYGLKAEVASKLNQLETGTAVLERDARNRHALLAERGFTFPARQGRNAYWEALRAHGGTAVAGAGRGWLAAAVWVRRTLRYVAFALRLAQRCLIEAAMCVVIAGLALIPLVAAIIVLAPPE